MASLSSTPDIIKDPHHVSAQQYESTLHEFASDYPDLDFEDFRNFVLKDTEHAAYPPSQRTASEPYATLYSLGDRTKYHGKRFDDVIECSRAIHVNAENSRPQILFLKGYPSSEWLTHIGSSCLIEHEKFNSHLLFDKNQENISSASLPSSLDNTICLKWMTVGSKEKKTGDSNQEIVDSLRRQAANAMQLYWHGLQSKRGTTTGDSIVRDFYVLDEKHFVIEQSVSIFLSKVSGCTDEKSWILLICTDTGRDLSHGLYGPWQSDCDRNSALPLTKLYPTVQSRSQAAILKNNGFWAQSASRGNLFPQTAGPILDNYAETLDKNVMKTDPFYALTDLLELCALSDSRFLSIIESKIRKDTGYNSLAQKSSTLANLLYFQEIINEHILYLSGTLEGFEGGPVTRWPKCPPSHDGSHSAGQIKRQSLKREFEKLLHRSESLSKQCSEGMAVIMNNAMLAESKEAIEQAKILAKLTLVAFFYIPLSFTASFFGMNFKELGSQTSLSIFAWFAMAIPLLVLTISFLYVDVRKSLAFFRNFGDRFMRYF